MVVKRTYLRVRRKRSAAAAEAIYLQGLGFSESGDDSNPSEQRKRIAVLRRVAEPEDHNNVRKREYRVLDAVLDDDVLGTARNEDQAEDDHQIPAAKRRRLTLLPGYTTMIQKPQSPKLRSKGTAIRILDPDERLVDDSLQQVFQGERTVLQHYRFITTDPRLSDQARKWCAWQNLECGGLLHACALWNEYQVLSEIVPRLLENGSPSSTLWNGQNYAASLILDSVDGEGRTPYQIAELSGHEQVCQVLEAYGAGDYFVDIYALEEDHDELDNVRNVSGEPFQNVPNETETYFECELKGGVGYWNEMGQLILEHTPPHTMSNTSICDEDESVDSNHEDWDGNDYPDFEDTGSVDDDLEINRDEEQLLTATTTTKYRSLSALVDSDGEFDAAYGVYGQHDTEEYDSEL